MSANQRRDHVRTAPYYHRGSRLLQNDRVWRIWGLLQPSYGRSAGHPSETRGDVMRRKLATVVLVDYIEKPWKYGNGKYDLVTWAMRIVGSDSYIDLITKLNVRRQEDDTNLSRGESSCV